MLALVFPQRTSALDGELKKAQAEAQRAADRLSTQINQCSVLQSHNEDLALEKKQLERYRVLSLH